MLFFIHLLMCLSSVLGTVFVHHLKMCIVITSFISNMSRFFSHIFMLFIMGFTNQSISHVICKQNLNNLTMASLFIYTYGNQSHSLLSFFGDLHTLSFMEMNIRSLRTNERLINVHGLIFKDYYYWLPLCMKSLDWVNQRWVQGRKPE